MASIKQPVLSIAIPTYNRARYLEKTLHSIVVQKRFIETDDVEIIISDNCSVDDTEEIVCDFIKKYGDKIKYFKNENNVSDKNFELSLRRGSGKFLKLNNDTLGHRANSLDNIIKTIEANTEQKRVLFFLNRNKGEKYFIHRNLDEFLALASFYCTWIGSFGMWKDDLDNLSGFDRYSHLHLTQTDVLFRMIGSGKEIYVNGEVLFENEDPPNKGGYDILAVFLDNYTFLLKEAVNNNILSKRAYDLAAKRVLLYFITNWLVNTRIYPEKFNFIIDNSFQRIFSFFKERPLVIGHFLIRYYYLLLRLSLKKRFKK